MNKDIIIIIKFVTDDRVAVAFTGFLVLSKGYFKTATQITVRDLFTEGAARGE